MLCQFTFSNYRSFRDEMTFSMQATQMKEFSDSLIPGGDSQRLLPVAAVYGPNAGGKTNLYRALEYVCGAVAIPITALTHGGDHGNRMIGLRRCNPFAFDAETLEAPSDFELYFRTNGYEYRYELEVASDQEITYEALNRRKVGGSRPAMLFTREGGEVALGPMLKRSGVSTNFNVAIPYLSFLGMNSDLDAVQDAVSWFVGSTFLNYNSGYLEFMLEQMLDEEDSDSITGLLRSVDIRIDGFRTEANDAERGNQRVFVRHKVNDGTYELRLSEESAGTQKMLGLAKFLLRALARGTFIAVDELDAKLHPKLLRFVTLLFKNPEINRNGAQLFFTSQDVSTMRNNVFRRDEIWFAAKDEDESSQLWSLADIHESNGNLVSKNAAFDRQYLAGRYGADPYLSRMEEWVLAHE